MNLLYGFSFYPEHIYEEEAYQKDLKLIFESGANVVRMGEFCWDVLEPQEGVYDFSTIERAVNDLGKMGIQTIICTPTACPPAWMSRNYPEIAYVDNRGVRRDFGARHHYCYNNETYRGFTKKIVEKIGETFGKNPYVAGFQIGNEFAQEGSGRCHCDVCREKFVQSVKERYKATEKLNQSWGLRFWGQSYTDFDQIKLPIAPTERDAMPLIKSYFDSPSLRLNFERFASDSFIEYFNLQVDILKTYTNKKITTNTTGFGTNDVDCFKMFQTADVFGLDAYPDLYRDNMDNSSFENSFARNIIRNEKFWMLEFSIGGGHGLWSGEGRLQPYPGAIENAVMHTFASDAGAVVHFQYKIFCSGAEQLNYALIDQDRVPRRRYFEFQRTMEHLKEHSVVLEQSRVKKADTAILIDYNSLWALRIKPVKHEHSYIGYACELYTALKELGYSADVISWEDDFSDYKTVIVPNLFVICDETAEKLKAYAAAGGTLVGTFLTAIKDTDNVAISESGPCGLTEVFGVNISEIEPVFEDTVATIDFGSFQGKDKYWLDVLESKGAEPIGTFADTYRRGEMIVSKNKYQKGTAYYIGTAFDDDCTKKLLDVILMESNAEKVPFAFGKGVEVITRESTAGERIYYIFNFKRETAEVRAEHNCICAITGKPLGKSIQISPKGYIAIKI